MNSTQAKNPLATSAAPIGLRGLAGAALRLSIIAVTVSGILSLFAGEFWLSDLMANLRLQLVIAGAVLLLITVAGRQWKSCAVQALLIVLHLVWIMAPPERARFTSDTPTLTVTAVNVYIRNQEYDRITETLRATESDVIMVTELMPPLHEHLQNALQDSHPHVAAEPYLGAFGVAIYSRYPLTDTQLIGARFRGSSLLATVNAGGQRYRIAAVHPVSPMTPARFELRNEHLQALSHAIRSTEQDAPDIPLITMGDFNLTPWSPHFESFQRDSGLQHVASGSGVEPTWYARGLASFPVGLVLDHCFVSPNLKCVSHRIGPSVASDHLPITVQLAHVSSAQQAAEASQSAAVSSDSGIR